MLKLKDIFNIDLNSKGGGKLYKKIMRKYNIPLKDTKEVKQEIVECSSGGNSGVKEYYYKIITDNYEILNMLRAVVGICNPTSALFKRYDDKIVKLNAYITSNDGVTNAGAFVLDCIAFAISSEPYNLLQQHEDYIQITISSGDFFDKVKNVGTDNETLEILNSYIQEITKEEYESMITYKP